MLWLILALFAYLANAVTFVVDKYLLTAPIPKPLAYAFWMSVLSVFVVVILPFGVVSYISWMHYGLALICGICFFLALIFLYKSVRAGDLLTASTNVGVFTAIFSYITSRILIPNAPANFTVLSAVLLVIGIALLGKFGSKILASSALAGLLFGVYFVLMKIVFIEMGFWNGIFWTRMGFVPIALLCLVIPAFRRDALSVAKSTPLKYQSLVFLNKTMSTLGYILLYYAILLGDVALVNGLLGVQFFFVLLLALALKKIIPEIGGNMDRRSLTFKFAGIIFVITGYLMTLI